MTLFSLLTDALDELSRVKTGGGGGGRSGTGTTVTLRLSVLDVRWIELPPPPPSVDGEGFEMLSGVRSDPGADAVGLGANQLGSTVCVVVAAELDVVSMLSRELFPPPPTIDRRSFDSTLASSPPRAFFEAEKSKTKKKRKKRHRSASLGYLLFFFFFLGITCPASRGCDSAACRRSGRAGAQAILIEPARRG